MLIELNDVPIPTWTTDHELSYCEEVAARSKVMVESGTYLGASARAMLAANRDLHLWAVDKFMVFGTEQITRLFLHDWIKNGHCEIIVGDSEKAASMLQHMAGKIDAAWLDDGHAKEDLQRDIRCLLPLLRSGGELFGHDWEGNNDVAQGVLSMLPKDKLTFPRPRIWSYIKP